jgi:ABC-type polysaccharide/polyol phosphate export permease
MLDAHEMADTAYLEGEASRSQAQLRDLANDAFVDIGAGLRKWPLWFTIGWLDIKQRYRRSLVGPFWITMSIVIFIAGVGVINSALFHMPLAEYLPFLATGLIVWTLISGLITDGCNTFIGADGAIKQIPMPISVHIYRMVWRNLIIFFHNFSIYVFISFLPFDIHPNVGSMMALVGLVVVALNGIGFGIILGLFSARFRDVPPTIANLVQLSFLTTPVLWRADTLPAGREWLVNYNPFFYLVESVRQPLLGHVFSTGSWLVTCALTAVNLFVACLLYARFRARIAYWL